MPAGEATLLTPATGRTPRRVIGRVRGATISRYEGTPRHPTPVLLVPNLGIAPAYIFDLLPGRSLVEHLLHAGFDVYLLDWCAGEGLAPEATVEDVIGTIFPRACRMVGAHAKADAVSIVAYCMGAAIALASFASDPPCRLRALVTLAGPVDFARAGLFTRWVDSRSFNVDRLVNVLGCAPPALFWVGGTMLRPTMGVSALLDALSHRHDPGRLEELRAVGKWVAEFVAVPGEFFRGWITHFYQDNRLYRGTLHIAGRRARLETLTCPVLVVAAREDPIAPPPSARALLDVIGSRDGTYLEVAGSHLALVLGPQASGRAWPEIAAWLAARDQ
jgi:poly[(R)-3-hydroxyalkanoate] polymerase subunit PhaC